MADITKPVHHLEALELASLQREESNLARCYLELHELARVLFEYGHDRLKLEEFGRLNDIFHGKE